MKVVRDTFKEAITTCFHILTVFDRPSNSTVSDRSSITKYSKGHSVLRHMKFAYKSIQIAWKIFTMLLFETEFSKIKFISRKYITVEFSHFTLN